MELISALGLKDNHFIAADLGIVSISAQIVDGHSEGLQEPGQRGCDNVLLHNCSLGVNRISTVHSSSITRTGMVTPVLSMTLSALGS